MCSGKGYNRSTRPFHCGFSGQLPRDVHRPTQTGMSRILLGQFTLSIIHTRRRSVASGHLNKCCTLCLPFTHPPLSTCIYTKAPLAFLLLYSMCSRANSYR